MSMMKLAAKVNELELKLVEQEIKILKIEKAMTALKRDKLWETVTSDGNPAKRQSKGKGSQVNRQAS